MTISDTLSPPLAEITPSDQRGVLWTVGVICFAFIYITFAVRAFVRWRRWQVDDYALLASCILVLAQFAVSFATVGVGLGSATLLLEGQDRLRTAWKLFIASEALFVLATFTAKAAVLLTVRELLMRNMNVRIVFQVTLALEAALALASVFAVTINCDSTSLLADATHTCSQQSRWLFVAIADSVTEAWGFALFIYIIWSLQMRLAYKITSGAILGLRLFCIAFAGVHAYYISVFQEVPTPAVGVITPLAWQQIALAWSLLSAMVVALRPFIRDFHTGMGMDLGVLNDSKYGTGSGSRVNKYGPNDYRMKELSAARRASVRSAKGHTIDPELEERYRTDEIHYSAAVFHGNNRLGSSASGHSEEPIIRRDVEYTVTYEEAPGK